MSQTFILRSQSNSQLGQIEHFASLDPCLAGGYQYARLQPGRREAMRLLEHGDEQACEIDKGFLLCIGNARMSQDWAVSFRSNEECLRIRILQAGRAGFSAPERRGEVSTTTFSTTTCCYAIQPPGAWMSVHYRGMEPLRLINLSVTRRYLQEVLGLADEDLPSALPRYWRKHDCSFGTLTLSRTTQRIATGLFNVNAPGRWLHVRLSTLGIQLLSEVCADWLAQGEAARQPVRFSRQDTDRVVHATELMKSTLDAPLTLEHLAKRVGLNRNKLHYGLRQLVGMSASDYYVQLRMEQALQLLLDTSHSVNRISEMLGYSEHTNFTSVFKKRFGVTPRDIRRDMRRQGA